jgi:arylsulfatase A-like enzyme
MTGRLAPRINDGTGLEVLFPYSTSGLDPEKEICLPVILKKQGYVSGLIGKWHLGHIQKYLPYYHGFDAFFGIPYPNDMGAERRFGLVNVNNKMPPVPLIRDTIRIKDCDKYDLAELPHWFLREAIDFLAYRKQDGKPFYLQWSNIETHTPWLVPKGFEDRSTDGTYGDAVEYFDFSVGVLLTALKELDLEKNTLVVVSSDNGNILSTNLDLEMAYGKFATADTSRKHILRGGKGQSRYEGGTRVSCIMRMPGIIPAGTECKEITTGADLFTTFILLAGAQIPSDRLIDGKDILPLMKGEKGAKVHEFFPGFQANGTLMSIRKGNWKLAVPSPKTWSIPALENYELYNVKIDPGEKSNVAEQNEEKLAELKELAKQVNEAVKNNKALPYE